MTPARGKWRQNVPLHIMLLPGLILTLIYSYGPMVGTVIAFQDFIPSRGLFGSDWVGFDNFKYVYSLPQTSQVIRNTLFISIMKMAAGIIVPIATALLLNEIAKQWFKRTVQTLVYLPHFMSWVILGGILHDILSPNGGIVNELLGLFGIDPIYFLGDERIFPYVLVGTNEWKEFGFSTIVYLAAITSINPVLYESAVIDGANRWQQMLRITLPGMLPIIVLMSTLSLGSILNAGFDQVFNLYNPSVYSTGDIIDTYVYRIALINGQLAVGTAIGLFKSVISFFLIAVSYVMAYRFANYRIF